MTVNVLTDNEWEWDLDSTTATLIFQIRTWELFGILWQQMHR